MEYIDYWNYENNEEDIEGEININSTFFEQNVIFFRGKSNWMVKNPCSVLFKGDFAGIPLYIDYEGKTYGPFSAKPKNEHIRKCSGIRIDKDGNKQNVNDIQRAKWIKVKGTKEYHLAEYKSSCGRTIKHLIGRALFPATYYSWVIGNTHDSIDLGEKLTYSLHYEVKDGTPKIRMTIGEAKSKNENDKIQINGEEISIATLSVIANKLGHQNVSTKKNSKTKSDGVYWFEPTNWLDINALEEKAKSVTNAVYMWWGIKKDNDKDIFLYIGIVGALSENHTVYQRIDEEIRSGIANKFAIDVKQFRYSMIKDSSVSVPEILKTVEMQCINNFSSIIPVYGEEIITPLFIDEDDNSKDKNMIFANIGNSYRIMLINERTRYHSS